jgi:hypothetical protein
MISIPENFNPGKDLYSATDSVDSKYVLRGFISFSGAHYVSYVRNLKTKV